MRLAQCLRSVEKYPKFRLLHGIESLETSVHPTEACRKKLLKHAGQAHAAGSRGPETALLLIFMEEATTSRVEVEAGRAG